MVEFIVKSVSNVENTDLATVRFKSSILLECAAANVTSTPEVQVNHYVCTNECTGTNFKYTNV